MAYVLPNSIFLPVPRTGGTWLYRVIERHIDEKKWEAEVIHNKNTLTTPYCLYKNPNHTGHCWITYKHRGKIRRDDRFPDKPAFCFVRHPLTWYRSYWIYRTMLKKRWSVRACELDRKYVNASKSIGRPVKGKECNQDDFERFLKIAIGFPRPFLSWMYSGFTKDCEFVGKQEALKKDIIHIFNSVGEEYDKNIIKTIAPQNIAGQKFKRFKISENIASDLMDKEYKIVDQYNYNYLPKEILK